MIYYGLNIIRPSIFLVTACLLCSLVSLVIGSSYTTAGTIGVAMIGIAIGLGISPAMTAGAVVSGAYFGDKMSPMSDTTNLAPAVAGSTIFDHIRHMIYTVTPTYIIALIVFFFLGRNADTGEEVQMEMKDILQDAMQNEFVISPWLMLPVVFLLVAVILKMPAIPAMFCAVVMGLIPWNVCGATMTGFLGVSTIEYAKYAVVNYVCPVISIIYGFTGFSTKKMSDEEYEKVMEQREEEEKALQRDLEA